MLTEFVSHQTVVPPTNIVTSRFLDLLSHLLKWDPADRYTVREALRHPFFSIKIDDEETRQLSQFS
jgi:dual-specificity kinase